MSEPLTEAEVRAAIEAGEWCDWHHRIEPLREGDFRVCFECGHVWRTREEFLADVERESRAAGVEPDPDQPFCPLCCHDF